MPFTLKTSATAVALSCLLAGLSPAMAQVSPDIMNLLIVAAEQDGGVNLDTVAQLAIAAKPEAKEDILKLVENLKQKSQQSETTIAKQDPPKAAPKPVSEPAQMEDAKITKDQPGYFTLNGWDGEAELNILHSTGNTRQQSFGLGGKMTREADKFHHTIAAFFDLNKNADIKDKQKWGVSYKLDYDFSEKMYITSFLGYENDQYGAFRERITTLVGIGYPVIATDSYSWKLEGGPSILFTKELSGEKYSSSFNAFASSIFKWTINDRSSLKNTSTIYFGDRSVIESKSALKVKINGALSSKFSYDILYDKDAPLGRKTTDTIARAGLLYDF